MLASLAVTALLLARLDSPVTDRAEALAKEVLKSSNDARSAANLIRLHSLLDDLDDLNLLAEPYTALIYRRNTDPFVRTLARRFMADVERARGRTTKAQELTDELHFVQDWQVVGSFENEGKSGCDTDFGPEAGLDFKASYPARDREVGWRKPFGKSVSGYVDLSLTLRPDTEAVAYAATFLQADADLKAELDLGVSGGARLWVNGVKVLTSDRYNQPRVDQQRVQVNLRKGLNRVLLKVCQQSGPLGFFFRADKVDGQRGALTVALPDAVPPLERGGSPAPQVLPTVVDVLDKRVKAAPKDAALRADFATVLAWFRAWPESENWPSMEADRAALNAPADAELQLVAASLHADDVNERRRFIDAALAADPKHAFARLALAQLELAHEHPQRALQLAEALLAEKPLFAPAIVVKLHALNALDAKTEAFRVAEDAFRALHLVPPIVREAVAASRRAERMQEAVERTRTVIALRHDDLDARRGLAAMLTDLGKVDEAVEQYRKVLALDPFDRGTMVRLGELLTANGHVPEGLAMFEQLELASPDEPDTWEQEGRALLAAQRTEDAVKAFQHSLALRPQNPALKEVVRTLEGRDAAGATPELFALGPLLEEAKGATSSSDALVLAELTHVRVQQTGLSSRFNQAVIKMLSQRGVESWHQVPISWSPDRQEVRVLKARITKPDGSVVDSFGEDEHNLSEPWAATYYDARAKVLSFPALAVGDVLELQWRIEDTAIDNLLSDYWGDVDVIQGINDKLHYRYVVDMPKQRPLSWNQAQLPAWVKASSTAQGERTLYRFEAEHVARVVPEPNMPGLPEVATSLHLSTYQNWEQVGRYYWGLVREQLVPNDELKQTVEQTLKGVDPKDTQKVVAAVYGWVVKNTRYVALEFGIHGYKPYRVDRILARRFGDCKDKASLIHAMLKVAGVDSRLVLLRKQWAGLLSGEVASLAAFNHAIVYVPSLDLFLDGTAEFHGSHELLWDDDRADVLIVEPEAPSRFLVTPLSRAEDNVSTLTQSITLKPDGSATTKGSLVARGLDAAELRRTYETPATRQSVFEQQWAQSYPGLQASKVTVSDVKDLEAPLTLTFEAAMPRYAEAGGGLLRFFPFGTSRTYTQALAPLSERSLPLQLPRAWTTELINRYTFPSGWKLSALPEPTVDPSPFGTLRITATREGETLVVTGTLVMGKPFIEPKDYPAFRAWLMQVDQSFSRKLLVQQGQPTARR